VNDVPAATPPPRIAAGYFLGACLLALFVFAWMRGAGRLILPLLLLLAAAVVIVRIVRAVKKPLP
jgi:uncharacterized membrane protein YkgB